MRDRSARERAAAEEHALAELLASRELRGFALTRHREIGPFVVDYLFPEQCLIVELKLDSNPGPPRHRADRLKFFNDMGYVVLAIDPAELARHPRRALARVCAALGGWRRG